MSKSLAEKVEQRFEEAVNDGVHALKSTERRVAERAGEAVDRVAEITEDVGHRTRVLAKRTATAVRERPLAAVGVLTIAATAIGFLLGRGSRKA